MSDIHDNPIDDADGARREALIGSARSLLPDIRSMVDEIDEARRLPDRLADKLADAGFFRMCWIGNWVDWRPTRSLRPRLWTHCPLSAPPWVGW